MTAAAALGASALNQSHLTYPATPYTRFGMIHRLSINGIAKTLTPTRTGCATRRACVPGGESKEGGGLCTVGPCPLLPCTHERESQVALPSHGSTPSSRKSVHVENGWRWDQPVENPPKTHLSLSSTLLAQHSSTLFVVEWVSFADGSSGCGS